VHGTFASIHHFILLTNSSIRLRNMLQELSSIDQAKKIAACRAVGEYVKNNMVVGVGSGSTVVYVVERLVKKIQDENLDIVCVATSFQSSQLIIEGGLKLGDLRRYPEIDVAIDGADEVDAHLDLIKGGGACQLQEKITAFNSKKLIVVADHRKDSQILGEKWKKGVPIEVIPLAYVPISKYICNKLNGKPILRMGVNKAGPVVTDNGNFILDVDFGLIQDPGKLLGDVNSIPGVVETGLFVNMCEKAYFGQEDGSVVVRDKSGNRSVFSR